MLNPDGPIAPPLKWHGGKYYLAKRIVALMPPHLHYVEPYAGGLSVLLAKDPHGVSEVVNDLNGQLTNFWGCLQNGLIFRLMLRVLEATPFSQVEWESAAETLADDYLRHSPNAPMDHAIAFFVRCRQSMSGRMKDFAPLTRNRTRRGMNGEASAWLSALEGLPAVHDRLKRVVILNRPALDVIRQQDGPNTLFYLDPPYLHETRTTTGEYAHEMTRGDHADLLDLTLTCKGKVMISGYPSDLYDSLLFRWRRVGFILPNNAAGGGSKRRMTEVVWMNFDPPAEGSADAV